MTVQFDFLIILQAIERNTILAASRVIVWTEHKYWYMSTSEGLLVVTLITYVYAI